MKNKIIKDALALTLITLVAGVTLGGVYEITKDPIAKQEAQAKAEAYEQVFTDAAAFEAVEMDDTLTKTIRDQLDQEGYKAQSIEEVMRAEDQSGETLGYAFTVVTSEGYGGDIQFSMGVQNDGTLNGISILSIGETAGLGMNADTPAFKDQFVGKQVEKLQYTKNGATQDDEINAISGATVTTNAMTNGECRSLCISCDGRGRSVMKANSPLERLYNGIIKENPTFVLMLGMCPTLAVTTSAKNGFGMGMTTMVILALSNLMISMLRKMIPDSVRMPAYIVVVASFVTIVQFLLQGFISSLYDSLGIYIPLIVVNCIILGRAEAYASKNGPVSSLFDGIGMGLGFTVGLTSIGIVRELIGSGKIFGMTVFNGGATIFILAPGAFFVLAMLVALQNRVKMKKDPAAAPKACDESLCAGCTNHMCASKKNAEKGGTQS